MELYILDSLLRRTSVIDRFESLIWTERYVSWGDFELVIYSTLESRTLLVAGTKLAMSDSYSVMTIEVVEDKIDSEGRQLLHVTGRSLEAMLDDRVARNTFADLSTTPKWVITGTPGAIMRWIFDQICRNNVNFPDDEIPYLQPGSLFPPSNIVEPDAVITVELDLTTVYAALKDIGETYNLGFRLIRNFDESELYFDVYSGNDRTTLQSVLAPVVFSPELDNLTNTNEINSISSYKNTAYVFHPQGVQIVYADGVSDTVDGFSRRVLPVDASNITVPDRPYTVTTAQQTSITSFIDITPTDADKDRLRKLLNKKKLDSSDIALINSYVSGTSLTATDRTNLDAARDTSVAYDPTETAWINAALQQRGKDELGKNRALSAFDGELTVKTGYVYEVDYQLGDLVEMRNSDGATNQMRVMEQIFVSDSEGERAYPTLTIGLFITPGSWFAAGNEVWANADGTWEFAEGAVSDDNILSNGDLEEGTTREWAAYSSSTITASNVAGDMHSGSYGLKIITTGANGGAANNIATLGDTPVGPYVGKVWIKVAAGATVKIKIQEYTMASVFVGESTALTGPGTGSWQLFNLSYTKIQVNSVIRISAQRDLAGSMYLDDAEIRKVI